MSDLTEIRRAVSRKASLVDIPHGEDTITFPRINGVTLVPVTKGHLFNASASTIRRYMNQGKLTKYLRNGTVKEGAGSEPVYFDLDEYLNLKLD